MKAIVCSQCSANDWKCENGFRICNFCGTSFSMEQEDKLNLSSNICINDDISILLKKSKDDPAHAKKYANLILDIDPTNDEALGILRR